MVMSPITYRFALPCQPIFPFEMRNYKYYIVWYVGSLAEALQYFWFLQKYSWKIVNRQTYVFNSTLETHWIYLPTPYLLTGFNGLRTGFLHQPFYPSVMHSTVYCRLFFRFFFFYLKYPFNFYGFIRQSSSKTSLVSSYKSLGKSMERLFKTSKA